MCSIDFDKCGDAFPGGVGNVMNMVHQFYFTRVHLISFIKLKHCYTNSLCLKVEQLSTFGFVLFTLLWIFIIFRISNGPVVVSIPGNIPIGSRKHKGRHSNVLALRVR